MTVAPDTLAEMGLAIRSARLRAGMQHGQLARALNVSGGFLCDVERGRRLLDEPRRLLISSLLKLTSHERRCILQCPHCGSRLCYR